MNVHSQVKCAPLTYTYLPTHENGCREQTFAVNAHIALHVRVAFYVTLQIICIQLNILIQLNATHDKVQNVKAIVLLTV